MKDSDLTVCLESRYIKTKSDNWRLCSTGRGTGCRVKPVFLVSYRPADQSSDDSGRRWNYEGLMKNVVGGTSNITLIIGVKTHGADRKSTRLNSSHVRISYAVFCLKKKSKTT